MPNRTKPNLVFLLALCLTATLPGNTNQPGSLPPPVPGAEAVPDALAPETAPLDAPVAPPEVLPTPPEVPPAPPEVTPAPPEAPREQVLVAYYGHPNSRYMGIVGRHSLPDLINLVKATAARYQALLPQAEVVPALYLIYGTVQPAGRIGYIRDAQVNSYIEATAAAGVQLILDHQIGTYSLQQSLDRLLPYLRHPHVHLAVDFEWRTARPMEEIGFVRGEELNWMQDYISQYLTRQQLPGRRYLIFHQFKASMVRDAAQIRTGYPQVELVHSTSGWGPPPLKRSTHAYNATISQIPTKAFKLWYYYSDKPGIHYDNPLMTPQEVVGLNPQPKIIIYQ